MATCQMSEVIQHLRRAVLTRDGAGLTDGQLLDGFITRREEAALAALVRRYGPMVWGVCRRVLDDHHDAEDAFQATFLVLVRKASSITPREMLPNWLYGVACQTAMKARATTARRRSRERQVVHMLEAEAQRQDDWSDLKPLLDRELSRLPDKYRVPIVLCDLEGKTRKEAARQLGWPEGTVAGRLARARTMLADRLNRHGLALTGGAIAVVLSQNAASACVPASLVSSTIKAAGLLAAGQAAAWGVISANAAVLTKGVLKTMFLTKIKIATAVLLVAGILGTGMRWLPVYAQAEKPPKKVVKEPNKKDLTEVSGIVKAVDASTNTIRIQLIKKTPAEQAFTLARDVQVLLDDGTGDRAGFQEGKPANLTEGVPVTLRLSPDRTVTHIWVEGPTVQGTLKAVDADKHRITLTVAMKKAESGTEMSFDVARNAKLFIAEGKVVDKSQPAKSLSLSELPTGAIVSVRLSADRKAVGSIRAEGKSITGLVKAVDGARNKITITGSAKGEADTERTLPVVDTAAVSIEDETPKDKTKPVEGGKLADVPVGARVTLRLGLDGKSVVAIRAEGLSIQGGVKAVDPARNTITVQDKGQGEKTYSVQPGALVFLDSKDKPSKLADVPVGAFVHLKLQFDQKTVREIRAFGSSVQGKVVGTPANNSISLRDKEGDKTFTVVDDAPVVVDGKAGKLTDLIDGTTVRLRLSLDRKTALEVHAEGPTFRGTIKGYDPEKNVLTLTIGVKANVEDREFQLTKDTRIQTEIYGVSLKPGDLRPERQAVVRLSIDQKAAATVTVLGE